MDSTGSWHATRLEVPVPAGRPQTVLVDLRGGAASGARAFRIRSNMQIHWDQVRFAAAADDVPLQTTELRRMGATLEARGFSREHRPVSGGPLLYDYGVVSRASPWKHFVGASTAAGRVDAELGAVDDRFVVAATGDEIALSFDAGATAPPASGRTRTFLLHADGFSKEMDLHSAGPDTVGPLPFHGMRAYPPPPGTAQASRREAVPDRERHVARPVPSIESLLVRPPAPDSHGPEGNATSSSTPNREAHR
jgi:hypothetical protein